MLNFKFLIPSVFTNYDLSKPIGPANFGSGMGVTYARIEQFSPDDFNCHRASEIEEIESDDIIFADWLWFCSSPGRSISDQAKRFIELPNPKVIYGSELCVLGWPRNILGRLIESADLITHNTEYQRHLYQIIGIYNSRFLCDPIPESIFFPDKRNSKRQLICMGHISEAKRSDAVAELFTLLEPEDIDLIYIGGNMAWGNRMVTKKQMEFQDTIKNCSNHFIENGTQQDVARIVNMASFYAHVSYHDVSSLSMQENMLGGNIVFGLSHPVLRERTPYRFDSPKSLAEAITSYEFGSDQYETDSEMMANYATKHWSFAAWHDQIDAILRLIT